MSAPKNVIVVGGGCAGIACAVALAQRGVRVRLLETRQKLGGRATSFKDVRTGHDIDNCQHVVMGCCTNYLAFCETLGVLDRFEWTNKTYWYEDGGRTTTLGESILPEPGHLSLAFLLAKFLEPDEKLAIARAMTAMVFADRSRESDRTFGQWLADRSQPQGAIEKFWQPVVVSACNLPVDRVSARVALHVFQEGFLANRVSPRIGLSRVPLVELYDRAERVLTDAGGELSLGVSVASIGVDHVTTRDGERLVCDRVVCAVPFERALKVVEPAIRAGDARFTSMAALTHSPILGVHLEFDRPVLQTPHAVLVGKGTHWLFRKDDDGKRVHAVISAADEWLALDESAITARVLADIYACIPGARGASVVSSRPVKEKLATYAATPEGEAARPTTLGDSGLVLAGDYVRSGWPATMEGAVRSGLLAAEAALKGTADGSLFEPDIPARGFARFLMA